MRRKNVSIVHASQAVYIDPAECDSMVGFNISSRNRGVRGVVELADCDRKVKWYFDAEKKDLKKADVAIEALLQFKLALIAAQRQFRRKGRR